MYDLLLIIHILAAMVWIGGGIYAMLESRRLGDDRGKLADYLNHADWVGTRVFGPAAFVTLLAGIGMVVSSDGWSFGQLWIWLAIGLFAVSLAIGAGYYGPTYARIRTLMASGDDAELQQVRKRLDLVTQIDAVILVTVVVLMVTKPGI